MMAKYSIVEYPLPLKQHISKSLTSWVNDLQSSRNINIDTMINPSFLASMNQQQAHLFIIHDSEQWLGAAVVLDILQNGCYEVGFAVVSEHIAPIFIDEIVAFCRTKNAKSISFVIDERAILETEQLTLKGARFEKSEAQMRLDQLQLHTFIDKINLREYKHTEREQMRHILMASFGDSQEESEAVIQLSISDHTRTLYGIYDNSTLVGTINLIRADEAYVTAFAVHPMHQGKGIGQCALAKAAKMLLGEGYSHVSLDVEVENEHALNLYRRVGFRTIQTFNFYKFD